MPGLNTHDYCMTFIDAMRRTDDPTRRRTFQIKIQERLLDDPWAYTGKLRRAVVDECKKGRIRNERV